MEKTTDRTETRDFMSVDSFSQLPFIRPSPLKGKPLRLFGIDFASAHDSHSSETTNNEDGAAAVKDEDNGKRFECHYCCRNFTTSQALGGHQNAHKRERQHAKRAQLHSAIAHRSFSTAALDPHIYGLFNYRIASAPTPPLATYPSWNSSSRISSLNPTSSSRFYGTAHAGYPQRPINGSPPGLRRILPLVPSVGGLGRERSRPLPLFAGEESKSVQVGGSSSSQSRFACEPKGSAQDHVSLDLHL